MTLAAPVARSATTKVARRRLIGLRPIGRSKQRPYQTTAAVQPSVTRGSRNE